MVKHAPGLKLFWFLLQAPEVMEGKPYRCVPPDFLSSLLVAEKRTNLVDLPALCALCMGAAQARLVLLVESITC